MVSFIMREDRVMKELEITAINENLVKVLAFVDKELEKVGCPMKAQLKIDIAVEEIFVNIANYAYRPECGPATIRVEVLKEPFQVILSFVDHGIPYDPLAKRDPDITLSSEKRAIGGLGIFMVKKSMDDIAYEYKDGHNILTIKKNL